jgi:phytoene synthase
MDKKYNALSFSTSKFVTKFYSTSFYSASQYFSKEIQEAIFSIYGFVRLADEIVDSFHFSDKEYLLRKFESDYYDAVKNGISLNPILHSFQMTVGKYGISDEYVQHFLSSMKADLEKKEYKSQIELNTYVYGSADVVGLMCLKVFCKGDEELFDRLMLPATKLGSAFQKVNFLRDIKQDTQELGRHYFPQIIEEGLTEQTKKELVDNIRNDFDDAYKGIVLLPPDSRLGVLIAYKYYTALLRKIEKTAACDILNKRIRISDAGKMFLVLSTQIKYYLRAFYGNK